MRVVGVFLGAVLAAFAITLGLRAQFDDLTPAPDTPVYVMAGEYASSKTEAPEAEASQAEAPEAEVAYG